MTLRNRVGRGTALVGSVGLLLAAGGLTAFAAPDAPAGIPDKDGEIKLCWNKKAANTVNGGAALRIYNPSKNDKKCKDGDKKLELETLDDDDDDDTPVVLPDNDLLSGSATTANGDGLEPATDASWDPITGLTLNLPTAGTYLINANISGVVINFDDTSVCFISGRLALNDTPVPGSQREVISVVRDVNSADIFQLATDSASISQIVTVAGATTLTVEAADLTNGGCAGTTVAAAVGSLAPFSVSSVNFTRIAD